MTAVLVAASAAHANVLEPAHDLPPLLRRRRHHRRRRRRPRRGARAEGLRPLRHRAGGARPRSAAAPTVQASPDVDLRRRLRLAAFGRQELLRRDRRTTRISRSTRTCRPGASAPIGKAFPQAERDDFMRAMDAFYERARGRPRRSGKDEPASLSLEPGNRWNPDDRRDLDLHQRLRTRRTCRRSTWTPMRTPSSTGASAAAMAR